MESYAEKFALSSDYRTNFRLSVDALFGSPPASVSDLLPQIERLTDAYIAATGERPDERQLDRLSTLIIKLSEEEAKNDTLARQR